ncbi:YeiH family protein [Haliangium sp.]|uniref:YeiH family protein n=1 Tax=Haliangium sp. TaxID=2663208 RepID=UPI003D0CF290
MLDPAPPAGEARLSGIPGASHLRRLFVALPSHLPGMLVAAAVAVAAIVGERLVGMPTMLGALLLGMGAALVTRSRPVLAPGIAFSAKPLLRLGVALLGARISIGQILDMGFTPVVIALCGVTMTITFGTWLAVRFGFGRRFGILTAGATAICGASAALAISSVLPRCERGERDTIFTVIGVTTLSTVAMVVYPPIVQLLGLDSHAGGFLLGGTIHDVAQVVGAGYSLSPEVGDVATFTKLLRVSLLVPAALTIAWMHRHERAADAGTGRLPIPGFLIGFVVLVILTSTGLVPEPVRLGMVSASKWLLITAVGALGMLTSLRALAKVGARAVALLVINTVFLFGLVLSLVWALT